MSREKGEKGKCEENKRGEQEKKSRPYRVGTGSYQGCELVDYTNSNIKIGVPRSSSSMVAPLTLRPWVQVSPSAYSRLQGSFLA